MERKKSKRGKSSVNLDVHGRVTANAKQKIVKGMADQEERDRIEAANVLSSLQFLSPKEEGVDPETNESSISTSQQSNPEMTHLPSIQNSGKSEDVAPSLRFDQGRQLQHFLQLFGAGTSPADKLKLQQQIANRVITEMYSHLAQLQKTRLAQWPNNTEPQPQQTLQPPTSTMQAPTATTETHMKLPLFIQQPRPVKVLRLPCSQAVTVNKNVATALRRVIPDIRTSREMAFTADIPQGIALSSMKDKQLGESISPALQSHVLRETLGSNAKTPPTKKYESSTDTKLPLKKRRIIALKGADSQSLESMDTTESLTSTEPNYTPTPQQLENIITAARNYPVSGSLDLSMNMVNSTISELPGEKAKGSGYVPIQFDPRTSLMVLSDLKYALTPDEDGDLPLHIAVVHQNLELVKKFVEIMGMSGKTVDRYNKLQQTPLHLAILVCDPDIVAELLAAGADPNLVDRHGCTSVHLAVTKGFVQCLHSILDNSKTKCDLNSRNYEGYTALHTAVESDSLELVQVLHQHGADLNAQDGKAGRSVVYYATEYNRLNITNFLVANMANVELQNYAGISPLMNAQVQGQQMFTAILLKGSDNTKAYDDMAHTTMKKIVIPRIPSKASLIVPGAISRSRSNSLSQEDVKPKFLRSLSIQSTSSSPMDLSLTRDTASLDDHNKIYKLALPGNGKMADVKQKHPQIMAFLDGKVKPYIGFSTSKSPVKYSELLKLEVPESYPSTVEDNIHETKYVAVTETTTDTTSETNPVSEADHSNVAEESSFTKVFGEGISWEPIKTQNDNKARFLRVSPYSTSSIELESFTDSWIHNQNKNMIYKLKKIPDKLMSVESETFSIVSNGEETGNALDIPEIVAENVDDNNSRRVETPGSTSSQGSVEIGPEGEIITSSHSSPSMPVLSRLCSVVNDNDKDGVNSESATGEERSLVKTIDKTQTADMQNADITILSKNQTIAESSKIYNAKKIVKQISQDSTKFSDVGYLSSQGFSLNSSQDSVISKSDDCLKFSKQISQELSSESNDDLMEQHPDIIASVKLEDTTSELRTGGENAHADMETNVHNPVEAMSCVIECDTETVNTDAISSSNINEDHLHDKEEFTKTMEMDESVLAAVHALEWKKDIKLEPPDEHSYEPMDDSQDNLIIDEGSLADTHNHNTDMSTGERGRPFEIVNEAVDSSIVKEEGVDNDSVKSKVVYMASDVRNTVLLDPYTDMEIPEASVQTSFIERIPNVQLQEASTSELTPASMDVSTTFVEEMPKLVKEDVQETEDENLVTSSEGDDKWCAVLPETPVVVTSSDVNEESSLLMRDSSPEVHDEEKVSDTINQQIINSGQLGASEAARSETVSHEQLKTGSLSMLGQPRMLYYHDGKTFQPIPIFVDESVRASKLLQNMFKTSAMNVIQANATNLVNLTTEQQVVTVSTNTLQSGTPESTAMTASSSSSVVLTSSTETLQSSYSSVTSSAESECSRNNDGSKLEPVLNFSGPRLGYGGILLPAKVTNKTSLESKEKTHGSISASMIDTSKNNERLQHPQNAFNAHKFLSASGHMSIAEKSEPVVKTHMPVAAIDNRDISSTNSRTPQERTLSNKMPQLTDMRKKTAHVRSSSEGKINSRFPVKMTPGVSKLSTVLSETYPPHSLKAQLTSYSNPRPLLSSRTVSVTSEGTLTRVNPDIRNRLSKALQSPKRKLLPSSAVFDDDQNFPTVVHRALSETTDATALFTRSSSVDTTASSPKVPVQVTTRLPL